MNVSRRTEGSRLDSPGAVSLMTSGSRQPVAKRTPIVIDQLITPVIQTDSATAQATHKTKLQLCLVCHGKPNGAFPDRTLGGRISH